MISRTGGHFAAGLGVIELTVALHAVFNFPKDQLIWDVGHQAYAHKMLTGRKDALHSIRKLNGISGFPKRSESPFDAFGTGHASTSISAALGMAEAALLLNKPDQQHIAVIGDGALTGGLAFEGLNNAGMSKANLLIILNDNSISIDRAVGALSKNLENVTISSEETTAKNQFHSLKKRSKATQVSPKDFFNSLNLTYHGPNDGHNLGKLINHLTRIKQKTGVHILHIKTKKGKGYPPAEQNQITWHAPGKFDKLTGIRDSEIQTAKTPAKYQDIFGQTMVELAEENRQIVAITPAMPSGSSLNAFIERFPDRSFDVGIAEAHAVTFAAGLATQGLLPFCCIYSTFLQRAYDQVIHDVCLQKLSVIFCIDRAGNVGEDGPTHHGMFDIAYLRSIPNLTIAAPRHEHELRNMLYSAQSDWKGTIAIRYPRGLGELDHYDRSFDSIPFGQAEIIEKGEDIAILAFGNRVRPSLEASKHYHRNITVVNMRFAKPLDEELLQLVASKHKQILTIEDGVIHGGFGQACMAFLHSIGYSGRIKCLGYPDEFIPHGSTEELYAIYELDKTGILNHLKKTF